MNESLVPPIRDYRDPRYDPGARYENTSEGSVAHFLGDLPIGYLIAGGILAASYLRNRQRRRR